MAEETADETISQLLSNFTPTTIPYSGWPYLILAEIRTYPPTDAVTADWTQEPTPPNWTPGKRNSDQPTETSVDVRLVTVPRRTPGHVQHVEVINLYRRAVDPI